MNNSKDIHEMMHKRQNYVIFIAT